MINCNPETVSTDYDTSDRLYFEPLTLEDVLEVIHAEQQSGELARRHRAARRPDRARAREGPRGGRRPDPRHEPERDRPGRGARAVLAASSTRPGCSSPKNGTATDAPSAVAVAEDDRLPGARAPELRARRPRHGDRLRHPEPRGLLRPRARAGDHRPRRAAAGRPVPRRRDRDRRRRAVRRHRALHRRHHGAHRGGRHPLRRLGVHAAARSPSAATCSDRGASRRPARSPRASACADCSTCSSRSARACSTCSRRTRARRRTVPFVSKALGIPLAKAASLLMVGRTHRRARSRSGLLPERDGSRVPLDSPVSVKEAVLPFKRFRTQGGQRRRLGARPGDALDRRGHGHRRRLPARVREEPGGRVRRAADRAARCSSRSPTATSARSCCRSCGSQQLGFDIVATEGTAEVLARNGIQAQIGAQVLHGPGGRARRSVDRRAHQRGQDRRRHQHPERPQARADGYEIRTATVAADKPLFTTIAAARRRGRLVRGRARRGSTCAACRTTRSTAPDGSRQSADDRRRSATGSAAVVAADGPLCVGIDPHAALLGEWGLPDIGGGRPRVRPAGRGCGGGPGGHRQAAGRVLRAPRLGRLRGARGRARRGARRPGCS